MTSTVVSPCINICELNDENICVGCYRSVDEIIDWRSLSNEEQIIIVERADERKKAVE